MIDLGSGRVDVFANRAFRITRDPGLCVRDCDIDTLDERQRFALGCRALAADKINDPLTVMVCVGSTVADLEFVSVSVGNFELPPAEPWQLHYLDGRGEPVYLAKRIRRHEAKRDECRHRQ